MVVAKRVLPYIPIDEDGTFDSRYYTKSVVDQKIADASQGEHDHDDLYYRKAEISDLLDNVTRDDRYYQKMEVDGKLSGALAPTSLDVSSWVNVGGDFAHKGTKFGFFNATPASKPAVTGNIVADPVMQNLLSALSGIGLITNSTTTVQPEAFAKNEADSTTRTLSSGTVPVSIVSVSLGTLEDGVKYLLDYTASAYAEGTGGSWSDARILVDATPLDRFTGPQTRWEEGVDATHAVTNKYIVTGSGGPVTVAMLMQRVAGSLTVYLGRLSVSAIPIG